MPLNGSSVCGRVVPLIPGETRFNAALASRYGSTEQDIKDMLNEVSDECEFFVSVCPLSCMSCSECTLALPAIPALHAAVKACSAPS